MLKSSKTLHYVLHFAIAFVLVWPALILFSGPMLIHQYTKLTRNCDHHGLALYNAMIETDRVDRSAFVIGRRGFINALNSDTGQTLINSRAPLDSITYIETADLNLVSVAQFVTYLDDRNATAIFFESHPTIWTDFGIQNSRLQGYLEFLEDDYSIDRLHSTLRELFNLMRSGCQTTPAPQLPDDIRSASFILNYPSIHAEARDALRERSRQIPVYWVHDESYYVEALRGSADTLDALRQLPRQYNGVFGTFVTAPPTQP